MNIGEAEGAERLFIAQHGKCLVGRIACKNDRAANDHAVAFGRQAIAKLGCDRFEESLENILELETPAENRRVLEGFRCRKGLEGLQHSGGMRRINESIHRPWSAFRRALAGLAILPETEDRAIAGNLHAILRNAENSRGPIGCCHRQNGVRRAEVNAQCHAALFNALIRRCHGSAFPGENSGGGGLTER